MDFENDLTETRVWLRASIKQKGYRAVLRQLIVKNQANLLILVLRTSMLFDLSVEDKLFKTQLSLDMCNSDEETVLQNLLTGKYNAHLAESSGKVQWGKLGF